jgi:hypothetical protein
VKENQVSEFDTTIFQYYEFQVRSSKRDSTKEDQGLKWFDYNLDSPAQIEIFQQKVEI